MSDLIQIDRSPKKARKPKWLKVKFPSGENFKEVLGLSEKHGLATVCQEAQCPNIGECWNDKEATFMMFGDTCTRSCGFCAIKTGRPKPLDYTEPDKILESINQLGLKHAVVTSVNLDHLKLGGADVWADLITKVKTRSKDCTIEVLTPDFKGNQEALNLVFDARPHIFGHNVETTPAMHKIMRPQAKYERSLDVLRRSAEAGLITKTGLMLGAGETMNDVRQVMKDVRAVGVDILFLGQYLSPSPNHVPVDRYVHPDEFDALKEDAYELGFIYVESAPLVRSSYHAGRALNSVRKHRNIEAI
jgi:lipoic acid synthetase